MPRSLVTSVRVEVLGGHAHIGVWVRGCKAGTLVVDAADADAIVQRLAPEHVFPDCTCTECVERAEFEANR